MMSHVVVSNVPGFNVRMLSDKVGFIKSCADFLVTVVQFARIFVLN